jgi:hypothetical protein
MRDFHRQQACLYFCYSISGSENRGNYVVTLGKLRIEVILFNPYPANVENMVSS